MVLVSMVIRNYFSTNYFFFLVGYATITYFGSQIMQMAGFTLSVETFGIRLLLNNVGSISNFYFFRLGRGKLIITSFIIIIIDLLIFCFIFRFYPTDEGWSRVAVALFGLHSIIYIYGMKTAPTIVNAEILTFSFNTLEVKPKRTVEGILLKSIYYLVF